MTSPATILITGASRGLGAELTKIFLDRGFNVFATARTADSIAAPIGAKGELVRHALDVASYQQCRTAIETCMERFGAIDALINNASAYTGGKSIADTPEDEINLELDVTLRGGIYMSSLFAKAMRPKKKGNIFFISSTAGLLRGPGRKYGSLYGAAKAALIRYSECLNEDIADFGMQSHVLIPGNIRDSGFVDERAVSYTDIGKLILFMLEQGDNLSLSQVMIRPARI